MAPPDPQTWARINDLFHLALERPPAERDAFLRDACGGDDGLRADVTSLLAAHHRSDTFIDAPVPAPRDVMHAAAALSHGPSVVLGQSVGPYRVLRALGAGGMGEVYLAEDTRLGRSVALKALAPAFVGDEARRERLRREARAAAALTHPNIATVYALEQIDGHLYIASEYVEGPTLREELAHGAAPLDRAIDTGVQLARALAAAHARGVVHRDLKPENVIRTPSGPIKVLDFGLARIEGGTGSPFPTLTADGAAIGTPAYMSPEQIRGDRIDARSDIFALGVVVYELATGRNPFKGTDAASSLARVLEREPVPLTDAVGTSANPVMAAALDAVIRRALQKRADDRFTTADEVADALTRAAGGVTPDRRSLTGAGSTSGSLVTSVPAASRVHAWWQFHQAAASVAYTVLLAPLWFARTSAPAPAGLLLVLLGVSASIAATTLRLHLWFTAREYPAEWAVQHRRVGRWLRTADLAFVASLGLTAIAVGETAPGTTTGLVASAVAVLVSAIVIEPATTRAAFGTKDL